MTLTRTSYCVCISGATWIRWTSWRESKYYIDLKLVRLWVTAAKIRVNILEIACRDKLERRGSRVPVEREAQEESR